MSAIFEELPDEDGIGGRVRIYLNNGENIVVSPDDCLYLGYLNSDKQCFKISYFHAVGKQVGDQCVRIRGESQLNTGPMIETLTKKDFDIILGTCSCVNGGGKRKSRKSRRRSKRKTLKRK
jgi:hypothetical protein